MLVGSFVVSRITGFAATWIALILLLAAHLGMNYAAVRSVQMTSLNRQRANLVFSALLESDPDLDLDNRNPGQQKRTNQTRWTLLTPAETSNQERIFYPDNLLAWDDTQKLGFCHLGVNFPSFLGAPVHLSTSVKPPTQLSTLTALFASERYMLLFARRAAWEGRVVLKPDCSVEDRLKAWCHALLAARILADSGSDVQGEELVLDVASRTLGFLTEGCRFQRYVESLKGVGWDLDIAALETRPGRRVSWS